MSGFSYYKMTNWGDLMGRPFDADRNKPQDPLQQQPLQPNQTQADPALLNQLQQQLQNYDREISNAIQQSRTAGYGAKENPHMVRAQQLQEERVRTQSRIEHIKRTGRDYADQGDPGFIGTVRNAVGGLAGGLNSFVGLAGDATTMATGNPNNWIKGLEKTIEDNIVNNIYTESGLERRNELGQRGKDAFDRADTGGASGTVKGMAAEFAAVIDQVASNPSDLAIPIIMEQIPNVLGLSSIGKGAGKAVTKRALAKGVAEEAATAAGKKAATTAVVGAGAAMQGLDVGGDATDRVMNLPEEVLRQDPDYVELILSGVSPEEARKEIAVSVGRKVTAAAAAISVVTNKFLPTAEKALASGAIGKNWMTRGAITAAGESGQEILEEGGGQLVQNVGLASVDPSQSLSEGIGSAAGQALIGAGPIGFASGALSRGGVSATQANQREDTDLMSALQAYTAQREPNGPTLQIEDQNAVAIRDMGTMRVGGLNLTANQVLEFAANNTNNPRIGDIMSQPVSDTTKVEQVARILNAEQAARVEPEAVRRISGLIGGTTPVSTARQTIQDELTKIGDEVVSESPVLSAIRDTVNSNSKGKDFVSGLRSIASNYTPPSVEGQTFVARPERGGEGSVIMTPDQTAEEAQREREAQQAFRMAERRQQRFDQATGQGTQREDIRPGAPEPQAQFFLGDAYGDLAGTAATVVESASPGVYRIQYDSPTETDANGNPVTISEEVPALDLVGRVVRGTPRMTQELAGSVRRPRRGTGTDMNPRQSVDRTTTRAIAEAQQPQPPMVPPQEPNLTMTGRQEQPFQYEAQPSLNAQEMPVEENAAPEGTVESQAQVSGAPGAAALPAPPRGLPAPEAQQDTQPPSVTDREETAPDAPAEDGNLPDKEEPTVAKPKKPKPEKKSRVAQHIENVEDKVLNLERGSIVRYADKVYKEGLIEADDLAEIKRMSKDRDMGPEDIGPELISMLEINAERRGEQYSGRVDRVRGPRIKASEVVARTQPKAEQEAQPEPDDVSVDFDAIISDRLDKIAQRGGQGRIISKRLRSLLKDKTLTAGQLYAAFRGGDVASRILAPNSKVDILWVPVLTAENANAAQASGTQVGEEAAGSYKAYDISQNGFRGIIKLSLSDTVSAFAEENAAHEAFHVIQDMLRAYDKKAFDQLNSAFRDGMRIDDLDASILRKLKTITTDGNQSVYDSLKQSFGDTPLGKYEAQAVAFGAFVDAKNRGEDMKGLKASFIRVVDFASDLFRELGRMLRRDGVRNPSVIFEGYRTGKAQEALTEAAPLAEKETPEQYSARRYNPDKGLDSAIENLKEDITQAGGEIVDAASIDELVSSDEIPVITVKDLVGKKIFPTISDRTAAAALYTGIDSSQTVAIPMLGGPNYPLRKSSQKSGVVWANRGGAVLTKKMNKVKEGANYMMVMMGSADMHRSNTTVNNAFFVTLEAYARDGRISGDNATALTEMIKTAPDADARIKKYLEEFPGFDDAAALDNYIHRISFDARNRIMKILGSKAALDLGAPSLRPILEATREPSMAGHRWGDGVLVVELAGDGVVELGKDGTMAHPDFPLGMRGRVVGRLATPINYEVLWQDFIKQSKARTSERGKTPSEETARYDFQQSLPIVEVTQELADRIGDLDVPNIDSARQAQLAAQMISNNWRTSDQTKKDGGVSVQEFVDAINNSPAKTVLNEYTASGVTADIKSGKMSVYQLGNDGQIFFALKKGDPQYAEDYGVDIPMIGKDEVMVTAVINNEQGARGIAAPAVMLKAIQEGATVLDCFAVKSKKFPDGFLPSLYEQFGFVKVAEVPFAPEYYSERKLADAVKYWKDSTPGYNPETDGYPPLVIMKWIGTNEERTGILDRYLRSGIEGLLEGRDFSPAAEAEAGLLGNGADATGEAGTAAVSERTGGAEGTRAGSSVASRARQVVEAIAGLSDQQLANLGLSKNDRLYARLKTAQAEQYSARIGGSMANRLAANSGAVIRRNAPKFRDGPTILGVDRIAEKYPKLSMWYERLVNRTRPIKQLVKNIDDFYSDTTNIDRAEQLMGSRAAYQTKDFHLEELKPMLREIAMRGLTIEEVETYLHNKHAQERNAVIRERNEDFKDGGSGITDADASAYLAALPADKKARLEAVAVKVRAITDKTLQILQDSGVESAMSVNTLRDTYKNYVPLFREGMDGGHPLGTRGASVEGASLKAAIGSSKPVENILANIILQREAAVNRAEANRLGNTVFRAALENQDQNFWMVIDPSKASLEQVKKQLSSIGMDPDLAEDVFKSPTKRAYNKRTGQVETVVDTAFKRQSNVFATRIDGQDKFVVFNPDVKMAADIAAILKNEDLPTLEGASAAFINNIGSLTRIWSQLRTQFMPEFGPVNFTRDMWGVLVNLSSTPLDGEQFSVMGKAFPYAKKLVRVILATDAGNPIPKGSEDVAELFDRFEKAGGRTAIRESFFKNHERSPEQLEKELTDAVKQLAAGRTSAPQVVIDSVTAWNDALENATRLSVFKAGIDKGLTDAQAAEIAKNISVNFNQRGQWTREINALYGFANANIASTDRNMKTMLGKSGKKILVAGIGLGVIQGMILAAAGFDDDDVPEWVKDHAFVIPIFGTDKYIPIPMPYFYNIFPAVGRRMVEVARGQLSVGDFLLGSGKVIINSINPIAYGAGLVEAVAPSVFDMFVQYWQNKDGLGRRIYNENFNDLAPTTGMSRARGDTTVMYAMYSKVAEVINSISGGDEYAPGSVSPTPEEIKFFVEQVMPPVQFLYRSAATVEKGLRGEEIESNEIAFLRRFYGQVGGKTAEGGKFYENVREINVLKQQIKGREEAGVDTADIFEKNPKAELYREVGRYYRDVSDLRRERRQMILEGASAADIAAKNQEITESMKEFNDMVDQHKTKE